LRGILLFLALSSAVLAAQCYTNVTKVTVPVIGVSIGPTGEERGVVGKLEVTVAYPGEGNVYVSSEPLTQVDTQGVARIAVIVASVLAHKDWTQYDFFFKFITPSTIVGGPSAGVAMTVAAYAALTNQQPKPDVAGTGTVGPDGVVGPVGGIYAKMVAAAKAGYKIFVIPKGEEITTKRVVETVSTPFGFVQDVRVVQVNVTEEGAKLGIKVVPVPTVYDALGLWVPSPPRVEPLENIELPEAVRQIMYKWRESYLSEYEKYSRAAGYSFQARALLARASELARMSEAAEDPYQSVNYAFTAAILAEEAYWYDRVAAEGFKVLIDLSNQAENAIRNANITIMNSIAYDVNKLDALITAASRALKSYYYYNKALNSTSINDIINYLVFAKYYARAALTWLDIAEVEPKGPAVAPDRFKRNALAIYSAAGGVLAYYLALASQTVSLPTPELAVAAGMYKEANNMPFIYRMAAGLYLSAITAYTLHLNYNISPDIMIEKVMRALHYNAGLASSLGLQLYVAAVYYHAAASSTGEEAFLFAELASMHYLLLSQLA